MSFQMNAPLHEQVRWDLLQRIRRGEFQSGVPIPNEAQLCEEYGVSRITIRRAIGDLCAEEFLYRKHGVGTFVIDAVSAAQSIKLRGSLADILAEDPRIRFELAETSDQPVDEATARVMERLAPLKRLDFQVTNENKPYAYAQLHVPAKNYSIELRHRMNGTRQPILILAERMNCTLAAAEQTIYAGSASADLAKFLELEKGRAILQIRRTYFDVAGQPIGVVVGYFHPDRVEMVVKLQLAAVDTRQIKRALSS